ncbi:MAG: peptidoglycan DD-metalloendopeptidase family protein [Bacillota bacterium]|nr:peptidoglycan DD-metalloendopeptidase family protein [Bacillota bacterium]
MGAFMLLCVTVPALMWLLSPRASIPAFPSFYPPATPLASGPPESGTPAPDAGVGGHPGTPAPGPVEPGTPAAAEPGTPARGEEIAASAPSQGQVLAPGSGERTTGGQAGTSAPEDRAPGGQAGPSAPAVPVGGQGGRPAPDGRAGNPAAGGAGAGAPVAGGAVGPDPGDLVWPLEGDVIAEYGFAYSEVYGDWRLHPGIDIAGEPGGAVRAAAPGTVKRVSREEGWVVEIDHGGGVVTAYGNLGEAGVRRGRKVAAGQVIGKLGDTAHLHFEVRVDGSAQDPLPWLKPR